MDSVPWLQYFTSLNGELVIQQNNSLISLPDLSGLQFNSLFISGNDALTSLPDFSGLLSLDYSMYIGGNNSLTNLVLSGLNDLKYLYIDQNTLTSIELSELTNLIFLSISFENDLSSLSSLSGLTNLSSLSIAGIDGLTSLPGLSGLTNLSFLNVESNDGLTSLPGLSGLTNLSNLDIYNNDALTSLPDLSGLTNLSEMYIYDNYALECVGAYPEHIYIQEYWPTVCPSACPYEAFLEYSPNASSYDYAACIIPVVMGCMDSIAENYNIEANEEDGSCEYILGCMDSDADNFNQESTQEDNSCIYYGCIDSLANNYDLIANQDDGSCIYFGCIDESADNFDANANTDSGECIYLGCIDESADNYNTEANSNDGSCIFIGCTNEIAENYNSQANQDDGSCIILGCTNFTAENYFTQANQDDESCLILGCTFDIFPNYNSEANEEDGSCDMNSEDVFGCTDSLSIHYNDLVNIDNGSCNNIVRVGDENFGGIVFFVDSTGRRGLLAAKDDLPGTYEWGCYGTGLSGADGQVIGTGFQNTFDIVEGCSETNTAAFNALNSTAESYTDWFLPSRYELVEMYNTIGNGSPEGNVGGFDTLDWPYYWSSSEYNSYDAYIVRFSTGYNEYPTKQTLLKARPIRAFGYTLGCMDSLACNYNPEVNMADGSCEYAEQGYDCEGNITAEIGDIIEGGYLFYLDDSGTRGLVAAMEDLEGTYDWGCNGTSISGADGTSIGTGYLNTLDIVSGCSETPIAASEALAYESEGHSDWFLPSKDELVEMYYSIGNGGAQGNIGEFIYNESNNGYWSSTENDTTAFLLGFDDGTIYTYFKDSDYWIRPIRSFGNWTMGCMDSLACNYNPEVNMADGSCEYPEQGYDCEGNITEYIAGMEAEGGIIFYVDETGQHGLVAAMEDIGTYEWGCFGTGLSGADGQSIGTGYQNSMDIVNQGCVTENGGITAAQAALDAEINGYSDWYLPSRDELYEMYNAIGNGSPEGNIGGFSSSWYWSSSEYGLNYAWVVNFGDGYTSYGGKNDTLRVRVIRAF